MVKVRIAFGEEATRIAEENGGEENPDLTFSNGESIWTEIEFKTKNEAHAYIRGVSDTMGHFEASGGIVNND